MGRPWRKPQPARPHGAHYRDDGSVWHSGTIARGSMAGESYRPVTKTGYSSIARPSSQYGHRESYPTTLKWRPASSGPPRAVREDQKEEPRRQREFVEIYGRPGSASSSVDSANSEQDCVREPWRPKSPDLRRRHPETGAMVGPHYWGGHRAFREDGTVWHTGSAARPYSQYGQYEWYPPHRHAGFVEAVASCSDLNRLRVQSEGSSGPMVVGEEALPTLDRPMSPEFRTWGAHAVASVAQAQASAAQAQSVAEQATRATWRATTAGDLSRSPIIQPLPKWRGIQSTCGPYPTQLQSRLEPESDIMATSLSQPKLHRGPLVDHAHPRRVASPDLLTHKDRTAPGTENIVCYLSSQDVSSAGGVADACAKLQAFCAAQINDHTKPTTNLIKFSLTDLVEPSQVAPDRLKKLGPALSSYSGRLMIVVPHGGAKHAPFDLGASAGSCSSNSLAQYICTFLMHLRNHHPAMLRTSQVDLVVDGTGIEIEDSVAERTPAQCLLDALRAYEDPLSLEDKVFSRPLSVTAPKGRFLLSSPGKSGEPSCLAVAVPSMDEQAVFHRRGEDVLRELPFHAKYGLKGYLAGSWSAADLSPVAMAVATVVTADPIGHMC